MKVTSKDGTQIAYDKHGRGPAVILVDGALGYRSFSGMPRLAELLSPSFTVYTYDRRGRGESSDTRPYSLEREIEDIDTLIDTAGGQAYLFGISSGACLVLEAALKLGQKAQKLALYEPPYNSDPAAEQQWKAYREKITELIAENRRGEAVMEFMRLVGVPADMVNGMRQSAEWPKFEAVAPTLIYDADAIGEDRCPPVDRASNVTSSALIMDGGANLVYMPFMHETASELAEAIPNAEQRTLEGQTHDVSMDVLAPVLVDFFTSEQ